MEFIQLSPSHGYKYVLVMVCLCSHWTEAFPCRQAIASSVATVLEEAIFQKRLSLPWETILNFILIVELILLVRCFSKSVMFGWFYKFFYCVYYLQFSGLAECTNLTVKAQLAKFVKILQIPWPKVLLLVLLNLKPIPFGTLTFQSQITQCSWPLPLLICS